jgi:hypothetical protein
MTEILYAETPLYSKKEIISLNKFLFLSLITFGLYSLWWTYKSWKLFQERFPTDELMPVWRTIFSTFTLYSLFERIKRLAFDSDHVIKYSSGWLVFGVIFLNALYRLPYIYGYISIFSCLFFIPPFEALNYSLQISDEYETTMSTGFNTRQIVLIVLGAALWIFTIVDIAKEISVGGSW